LTAILNALYVAEGRLVIQFWIINIYSEGVFRALFMAIRIILLILISALLTYTSTPTDLTDAIESLLSPLKFIGLKSAVHIMALMMTIALRFIPTLIEETDKIMSSQKARGASLDSGSFSQKIKALLPVLIPLLSSSIRRAYELADAMESRCYNGGEGRVRMKKLTMHLKDYIALVCSAFVLAGIIVLNLIVL
ncbi:MAG: energy-coupling factor transporter transmembrane protein EcfT, partial [Oscillospiraceae bacterium]|nr:energy-coupling factor transporter transmembrane protein EcfT [Candidatus Equicaccousia limihippi]